MEHLKPSDSENCAADVIRITAQRLVGKYGFSYDDLEDIQQELWLDLHQRTPNFNPKLSKPQTFFKLIVRHKVATMIRYRLQRKRDYRRLQSNAREGEDYDDCTDSILRVVSQDEIDLRTGKFGDPKIVRHDFIIDFTRTISRLSPDQKYLLELLSDKPIAEIAREIGVPRSTFYDRYFAPLREHLRKNGLDEYL